jgi:hypothetical protein
VTGHESLFHAPGRGNTYRYKKGCRCAECTAANTESGRRTRTGGVCESCGAKTDGSNGPAKAPRLCASCSAIEREPEHGSPWRYNSKKHLCRCEKCRAGWAAWMREYNKRKRAAVAA